MEVVNLVVDQYVHIRLVQSRAKFNMQEYLLSPKLEHSRDATYLPPCLPAFLPPSFPLCLPA
jgi:hypothetical protein